MAKLTSISNRLIYLLIFIIVFASILIPFALPVPISSQTRQAYGKVQALKQGSNVFVWISYTFGATAELNPMLDALLYQMMQRGANVVFAPRGPDGIQIAQKQMQKMDAQFPAYQKGYGSKWVLLGYNPAATVALREATSNIATAYTGRDYSGASLTGMALIRQAPALTSRYYSLGVVMDDSDGYLQWVNLVGQPQHLAPLIGAIQMEVPIVAPYLDTGQVATVIPGANGAAQYEILNRHAGGAVATQNTASLAGLFVVILLMLGNIGDLSGRKAKAA